MCNLQLVISGGQTGADRAGLFAAAETGIKTGGWMPKGFRALDGSHPDYADKFNIKEHTSIDYVPRTALNVKESDGTIRFASVWGSPGEKCTLRMIRQYKKPHLDIAPTCDLTPAGVIEWIKSNNIKILNIAGNSERTAPGIYDFTHKFLVQVFGLATKSDGESF